MRQKPRQSRLERKGTDLPDQPELPQPGFTSPTPQPRPQPRPRPTAYEALSETLSGTLLEEALGKAREQAYVFQHTWIPVSMPSTTEKVRETIHRAAAQTQNPSPFRFLNSAEIEAIDSWAKRGKLGENPAALQPVAPDGPNIDRPRTLRDYLRVSYHRTQGGFTICTLSFRYEHPTRGVSYEIRTGASRRSFKDPYNSIKGEMLALFRAVKAQPVTLP